ncbi:MAG: ABC-2 family transporter protein [Nocardioides sp.]|nr:ABC-2 family transporter protein [Nocardioides sp.]
MWQPSLTTASPTTLFRPATGRAKLVGSAVRRCGRIRRVDGLGATWSLHVAIATRSFRRYSTYVAATVAGIFTNSVFGIIFSFAYIALWSQRPHAGGYTETDAVTYAWLGQALLMTIALWGGGATDDLAERIRTGDVAVDLYRPVGLLGWYLAADMGRAAYHFLTRGLAPTVVGAVLFGLTVPRPLALVAFLLSVVLALVVSFAIRFLVAASAFWLLDASGPTVVASVLALFFSGMILPLNVFPDGIRQVALVLPWASYVQTPADLWLGRHAGVGAVDALGLQALWALVLLAGCRLVLGAATRKVVVQGG